MKIAVFGGSFNPIHHGHLLSAIQVLEKLEYEKVLFIPANVPVHKDSSSFPAAFHRSKMVDLAIEGKTYFSSSDLEIQRGGNSYCIDTIRELKEKISVTGKFGVVIGDDLIPGLAKWKEIDKLVKEVDFICIKREYLDPIPSPYLIKHLDNRIIEISSTEIRNRVKTNRNIDFLLPDKVKDYIIAQQLYL